MIVRIHVPRAIGGGVALLAAAFALHAGASPLTGFVSRDCVGFTNVQALGGEVYACKYSSASSDTPDVLFDAVASGGGTAGAAVVDDSWFIQSLWAVPVNITSRAVTVVTLPGEIVLDSGDYSGASLDVARPQVVGALDGTRPDVTASNWGYEIAFRPVAQVTPDTVPGCSVAGPPSVGLRPVIGYNIYRLPGAGPSSLAQFRLGAAVAFADARTLRFGVADADGLGCSDAATGDELRLLNPNGIVDDGDEVLVFRDTVRTPSGRARVSAPDPRATYQYHVQPVLRGDPLTYANGGTVSVQGWPSAASDRDGNGSRESLDLLADGRFEFIDPGMRGLGLTWSGEILSSPAAGLAMPGAAPADPDGDGIPTSDEIAFGLNPAVSNAGVDSDGDGPSDRLEAESGSHPLLADTDGGGERDGTEMFHGRSPINRCDDVVIAGRVLGDISPDGGDGVVSVADAVRAMRASVALVTLSPLDVAVGDVAPAEVLDAGASPPLWRRHGLPDAQGQHPYGRLGHGDGRVDIADAVLILRQSVGLMRVTD